MYIYVCTDDDTYLDTHTHTHTHYIMMGSIGDLFDLSVDAVYTSAITVAETGRGRNESNPLVAAVDVAKKITIALRTLCNRINNHNNNNARALESDIRSALRDEYIRLAREASALAVHNVANMLNMSG